MKLIVALLATLAVVNAYTCPDTPAINAACRAISVFPLTCSNPNVNVEGCNERQCSQAYIDNYAACQCRRSRTLLYEHSVNVEGLIRRCGIAGLTNPFGNSNQYRPGQGTQTFLPTNNQDGGDGRATRIYDGTTYYGGTETVISGTTTWVSDTPGIIRGTSTVWVATQTAAPIKAPEATPVETVKPIIEQDNSMSGGAIAGAVLGSLAAAILAGLLGWCWRKKRAEHTTFYSNSSTIILDNGAPRAPTRTVVTEKIEPVVVKSVPTTTTTHATEPMTSTTYPTNGNSSGNYSATTAVITYSTTSNPTTYSTSTTTTDGYNTQPRPGVAGTVSNGIHNTTNTANNGVHSAGHTAGNVVSNGVNAVGNSVNATGNAVGNAVGNGTNAVGNGIRNATNTAGKTTH
ncbi:hypothetical protein FBU30_004875 [Linnemannia zychae]|nr:hypothetical protein FBU30_004875 [Linnemannia zychae]